MTPQEEARERARLLIAFADSAQLQHYRQKKWNDWSPLDSPLIQKPEHWRIKPEPRKAWSWQMILTENEDVAKNWEENGQKVTEWQEVIK